MICPWSCKYRLNPDQHRDLHSKITTFNGPFLQQLVRKVMFTNLNLWICLHLQVELIITVMYAHMCIFVYAFIYWFLYLFILYICIVTVVYHMPTYNAHVPVVESPRHQVMFPARGATFGHAIHKELTLCIRDLGGSLQTQKKRRDMYRTNMKNKWNPT